MWLSLGFGLAAWLVGEVIWCYYELWLGLPQSPFPSPADAAYLLFPIGAAGALVLFSARGHVRQSRLRLLLDGVIVAGSLFMVWWMTVLSSVYDAGGTSSFALAVALAYPVADVVLVTMTVLVLARANTSHRLTLGLFTAGIGLIAFSDSAFVYLIAVDSYYTGIWTDVGWAAAFLLLGLAALSNRDEPVTGAAADIGLTRTRLWLPYVPLLFAGAVGVARFPHSLYTGPLPLVSVVLVMVVLVRQFITLADNRRLLVIVAHQAHHDPLTGLANRALLTDRLERAVQANQRDPKPLALLFIDLDDFKLVNDSLGHQVGDELLVNVARRLTGCFRDNDTVARMGGDEFAILLEEGVASAVQMAGRVVEAFAHPFTIDGHLLAVRLSVGLAGVAEAEAADLSVEVLLKHADLAMYEAKRDPAGRVHVFTANTQLAHLDDLGQPQDLEATVGASS